MSATHMSPSRSVNWSALALLRFILAWIVLSSHYDHFEPGGLASIVEQLGGNAAVVGFLMISGFSIASSMDKRPQGFLFRRLLRIYPMYFAATLMTVVVQFYVVGASQGEPPLPPDGWGRIVGNLLLTQMFLCKALTYNGPFWSLSLEWCFYVFAPLFLVAPRKVLAVLILVSAGVYILPPDPTASPAYILLTKFNALRYLWAWLLGFCVYYRKSAWVSWLGLALCLGVLPQSAKDYISPVTLITVGVSFLMLLFSNRFHYGERLEKLFNFAGDLSYPLYLVHFPILVLLLEHFELRQEALVYAVCCVVAWLNIIVFDQALKRRWFRPALEWGFRLAWLRAFAQRLPARSAPSYYL